MRLYCCLQVPHLYSCCLPSCKGNFKYSQIISSSLMPTIYLQNVIPVTMHTTGSQVVAPLKLRISFATVSLGYQLQLQHGKSYWLNANSFKASEMRSTLACAESNLACVMSCHSSCRSSAGQNCAYGSFCTITILLFSTQHSLLVMDYRLWLCSQSACKKLDLITTRLDF